MQTIIISIHPQHVKNIFEGRKTIELRKTAPKEKFKAIVYETKANGGKGMVVGEFVCGGFDALQPNKDRSLFNSIEAITASACVSEKELKKYANGKKILLLYIRPTVYFAFAPKPLSAYGLKRPPQSWQYLKESEVDNNG